MSQGGILPQKVVFYLDDDRNQVPYDTCYKEDQIRPCIRRCRRKHKLGQSKVEVINADKLPPEKL